MRNIIRLLLSFCVLPSVSIAAQYKMPPASQEIFAPYWTAEPGWHTEFQLRNGMPSTPLVVIPVLRLADGREYALTPVTIAGSDVVTVDVEQELAKLSPQVVNQPGSYGSAIFRFTSPHHKNLYAAVMVHEMGQPIGYHIDAFAMESEYTVGSREGIWWLPRPGTKDYLVIANGSNQPNHGWLFLYDAAGKAWKQDVPLAPRQTVRFSVGELVSKTGLSGMYGGIRFEVAERAGYIDTVHFVYDETAGFSALMKMFDHDPSAKLEERIWGPTMAWTLRAPMLALQEPDPALALPAGTKLQPKILVRNTTSSPLIANVKLTWRGESKQGVLKLPPLHLRAFETHLIDVAALQQAKQIPGDARWALVEISTPGKPDTLMAIASSYDASGRYGAQTPFSDQLADQWIGGEWQVDATHNTIIAVTNAGSKPTDAVLTFHYNRGQDRYEIRRTIAGGDQLWLNLGDIIHGRVADNQGRTFPPDLTAGSYDLREPDRAGNPSLFEGKIIVDKTYGHLAYGCLECCAYTSTQMLANPEQLAVQGQDRLSVQAYQSCWDDWTTVTGAFSGWDTGNHGVAMMASNQITGMGVGTTNGFASGSLLGSGPPRHCPMTMRYPGNMNVVTPTVTIAGPTNIPMLKPGYQGSNSITLTATGNPAGGTYSWSALSGQGNITILNGSSQSAIIQSAAVGTYTVQVAYTYSGKQGTAVTVGRVQQPGSLNAISNTTQTYNCANMGVSPYNSSERLIQYQVLDTSGPPVPIPAAGMSASETTLTVTYNTCGVGGPSPTNGALTFSNGYFPGPDTLLLCSSKCLPADGNGNPTGSCTMIVAQTWSVNGYAVKSDNITYTCPGPPTGAP